MKTFIAALSLAAACSGAAAQSSTMQLDGNVTPSACDLALVANGGGNRLDYGSIDVDGLGAGASGYLRLRDDVVTATVTCASGARVGLTVTDGRAGSAAAGLDTAIAEDFGFQPVLGATFGLGTAPGGAPIGAYYLHLAPQSGGAMIGSTMSGALSSDNKAASWAALPLTGMNDASRVMLPTGGRIHTWADISGREVSSSPAVVTAASLRYEVFPALLPKSALPLTGQIEIDGLATFTLYYL
nr:DUF1120 domain-containing protein [uncultured Cupriavidus sp.]